MAIENANLHAALKDKIEKLDEARQELKNFTWAASHNLKAPLHAIDNLSQWLEEELEDTIQEPAKAHLTNLRDRVGRMSNLLGHILDYTHLEKKSEEADGMNVDGETLLFEVMAILDVPAGFTIKTEGNLAGLHAARLPMVQILCNLIGNAVKHHDRNNGEVLVKVDEDRLSYRISVSDDGPGISSDEQIRMFDMFQSPHKDGSADGHSGMGMALVKKVLLGYGSTLKVDSGPGRGATFSFAWPKPLQYMTGKPGDF